jgi:hypothetical protein
MPSTPPVATAEPGSDTAPPLPGPRGRISEAVIEALRGGEPRPVCPAGADPYGADLQLALYCLYELAYRGFRGVDDEREWDPALLSVRRELEHRFLPALRGETTPGDDVDTAIRELLVEEPEARGVSQHVRDGAEAWQLAEYVAHRSLYHLKEADPQAFAIARLSGAAKTGMVTIAHDEYGSGDPARLHAHLYAAMMRELGLDDRYGAYLDTAPAEILAEVNLMSLCGLHRGLRGALLGQFATVELTSSPGAARLADGMTRLGCSAAAREFYGEHIEADAVHEQLVRRGVLGPLLEAEPELAGDVVFGIRASTLLASRFEEHLLARWSAGQSSLRNHDTSSAESRC